MTPSDVSDMANIAADVVVDASGLKCPLPILRAKKALAGMASGQVLRVLTTDTHAGSDFQAFCAQSGNTLLAQQLDAASAGLLHLIRRR